MWRQLKSQCAQLHCPTLQSFGFVFGLGFAFGCRFGFVFGFVSSFDFITWAMRALVGVVHSARADVNTEQRERASESEREWTRQYERIEQLANWRRLFIFFGRSTANFWVSLGAPSGIQIVALTTTDCIWLFDCRRRRKRRRRRRSGTSDFQEAVVEWTHRALHTSISPVAQINECQFNSRRPISQVC